MIYTKTINRDTPVYAADSVNQNDEQAFLLTRGRQRQREDGSIDRWVHLAVRGQRHAGGSWTYAHAQVTPDEARSLAAMLLDAADDADERDV